MAYQIQYDDHYQKFVDTIKSANSARIYNTMIANYFEFLDITKNNLMQKSEKQQ